jgi:hypothetical protein
MVVHDMDDPELFPYKVPQIRRIAHAFEQMLRRAAPRSQFKPNPTAVEAW